jgi:hypothetical protein
VSEAVSLQPKRPRKRDRLDTVSLIVKIIGGIVAVVVAIVGLYHAFPASGDDPAPGPSSPLALPPTGGSSPTSAPTTHATTTAPPTLPTQPQNNNNDHNTGTRPTDNPVDEPTGVKTSATTPAKPAYRQFTLAVQPGIAYDLENPSNQGWDGNDAGYAARDLYRTSETSANNRLQGVQVPVDSTSYNAVATVATGSSPSACANTSASGGGFVSLDSASAGTTFCVHTRGGHWAHVVITAMNSRTGPISVRVTMPA